MKVVLYFISIVLLVVAGISLYCEQTLEALIVFLSAMVSLVGAICSNSHRQKDNEIDGINIKQSINSGDNSTNIQQVGSDFNESGYGKHKSKNKGRG